MTREEQLKDYAYKSALYCFIWQLNTSIDKGYQTDVEETLRGCEVNVIEFLRKNVGDVFILDSHCKNPEYIVELFSNIREVSHNDVRRTYSVENNGLCFLLLKAADMLYND